VVSVSQVTAGVNFNGYIDDIRVTKGFARYTANFAPPIAAFPDIGPIYDPNFSNVSLLLHMDGSNGSTSFIDNSINSLAVTANGNAQISTAQNKFGGASAAFDGAGDYLSVAANTLTDLPGDFTIECWAYFNSLGVAQTLLGKWGNTNRAWLFSVDSATQLTFALGNNGGYSTLFSRAMSISTNTWNHFAVCRAGTTIYQFVNGVQAGATGTSSANCSATQVTAVGINTDGNVYSVNGYIDEARITKGVARYTSNFTPPTVAFPND
jgi:hypothetical protein